MSPKNSLNKQDIQQWGSNFLIFSSPALIALLTSLQNHQGWNIAVGMFYQAIIASLIDLLLKFKQAN